jgi:hypothetical protein
VTYNGYGVGRVKVIGMKLIDATQEAFARDWPVLWPFNFFFDSVHYEYTVYDTRNDRPDSTHGSSDSVARTNAIKRAAELNEAYWEEQ